MATSLREKCQQGKGLCYLILIQSFSTHVYFSHLFLQKRIRTGSMRTLCFSFHHKHKQNFLYLIMENGSYYPAKKCGLWFHLCVIECLCSCVCLLISKLTYKPRKFLGEWARQREWPNGKTQIQKPDAMDLGLHRKQRRLQHIICIAYINMAHCGVELARVPHQVLLAALLA